MQGTSGSRLKNHVHSHEWSLPLLLGLLAAVPLRQTMSLQGEGAGSYFMLWGFGIWFGPRMSPPHPAAPATGLGHEGQEVDSEWPGMRSLQDSCVPRAAGRPVLQRTSARLLVRWAACGTEGWCRHRPRAWGLGMSAQLWVSGTLSGPFAPTFWATSSLREHHA